MRTLAALFAVVLASPPAAAHPQADTAAAQALELLKRGVAFRSVAGTGNQAPEYAEFLQAKLIAGGFAAEDVRVERLGDTAYLVARYRGTGGVLGIGESNVTTRIGRIKQRLRDYAAASFHD